MGKEIKSKAKIRVNIANSLNETVNEVMFVDVIRVAIEYSDTVRLQAFGSLMYNDGVKDVWVNNINIDMEKSQLEALLGTQLTDLEDIIEKVAINQVAGQLDLTDADFEKKVKVKKAK